MLANADITLICERPKIGPLRDTMRARIAEITGPGLFYRLRESEGWLAELLAQTLQDQVKSAPKGLNLSVQQRWCEGRATLGGKTFLDKSSVEQPKV